MELRTLGGPLERNRLLAALVPAEEDGLLQHVQTVHLPADRVLEQPGQPPSFVYFPRLGCVVALRVSAPGQATPVVCIGHEGMVGLSAFLGDEASPLEAAVQIAGYADRIRADVFKGWMRAGPVGEGMARYTHTLLTQTVRTAACNCLHPLEQRLCRWLLSLADQVRDDSIPLTQHALATMLGARRPSVTLVMHRIQKAGWIAQHRGRVEVLDRQALEQTACGCYRAIHQGSERQTSSV